MTPLATHLEALGLTQRKLAALLNRTEATVCGWALGYRVDSRRPGGRYGVEPPREVLLLLEAWRACPGVMERARANADASRRDKP